MLCDRLEEVYKWRGNGIFNTDKIRAKRQEFTELDCFVQCKVLLNIASMSNRKMNGADLHDIGLAAFYGIDTLSVKFKPGVEMYIMYESATGLMRNRVKIQ